MREKSGMCRLRLAEYICHKGPASIQIKKGAKNDGWAAWRNLLNRYGGFTRRDIDATLKQLETLKHQHGTNIAIHLDKFDVLVSRLAQFGRQIPEDELIHRLKDSVTEDTYKAVKMLINQNNLPGQQPFSYWEQRNMFLQ